MARARIYAQDAIRHKQANNILECNREWTRSVQDRSPHHDVQGYTSDG